MSFFFFFFLWSSTGFICLELLAKHSYRPQSSCLSSNSSFPYDAMSFLCFLGALAASLVALGMGPVVLLEVWGIALKQQIGKPWVITFSWDMRFTVEITVHVMMTSVTWHALATLELTTVATGGDYKITTSEQFILQVISCSRALILHLDICLHFSQLQRVPCMVCKSLHKFW